MQKRVIKILATLFFVLLLATPWLMKKYEHWRYGVSGGQDEATALKRYGFYLQEVSSDIGIHFNHEAPQLDSKLEPIMPQVASVGASASVADFNNDGWEDIYLTNSRKGTTNALYENMGEGTFKDVAGEMGVDSLNNDKEGTSMGSIWGDYDNDGYEDLFVYRWGKPVLFHNDQGTGFTRVDHKKTDFPKWVNANTAIWFDYDRDGNLDLFMGGYFDEKFDLWHLKTTKIMPESFEYAHNGGRNYLFHNNGDGTFTEVAEQMGLTSHRWSLSSAATDLNGSGYPDLVVANDYGVDELFINEGGKHFNNIGDNADMGFSPKSGMNVTFGDVMNQGNYAIYITNISEPGVLVQGNNLWVPSSDKKKGKLNYKNLAGNMGVELGGWSYCAQFGDLNNDGFIDLYVANGYVSAKKGTDYWYDFSKIAGGNEKIINDAKNWPDMEGRSLSGYQQNKIWINDGAGRFQEVSGVVGGSLKKDSRAVAYADLWNRGVLDVIVANQNGPVSVFKNKVADDRNWIGLKLEGTESNRSAIGTQVEIYWNGQRQKQVVSGGSGFSSQNQRRIYFGLGIDPKVDKILITWPSGKEQTIDSPKVNQLHKIKEPK